METFFADHLGISQNIFAYVILPLLIFLARVADVSINTVRIIFVMAGHKFVSTLLGFFESLIWLMAIGQIFQHLNSWVSYLAYPGGFATGILVGMLIEERLAFGKVIVRAITPEDLTDILEYMKDKGIRYTLLKGESISGKENVLFSVLKREQLDGLIQHFNMYIPQAFYTVESVKKASDTGLLSEPPSRRGIGSWLGSIKRR
jgi:uncharacterized protein YebE (UPF0316 family)